MSGDVPHAHAYSVTLTPDLWTGAPDVQSTSSLSTSVSSPHVHSPPKYTFGNAHDADETPRQEVEAVEEGSDCEKENNIRDIDFSVVPPHVLVCSGVPNISNVSKTSNVTVSAKKNQTRATTPTDT